MANNLQHRHIFRLTEIAFSALAVNGVGVAGAWVDKDISAVVGIAPCWVECVIRSSAGGTLTGIRTNGSAVNRVSIALGTDAYTQMVYCVGGLVEAYQNVAGLDYIVYITGYWR